MSLADSDRQTHLPDLTSLHPSIVPSPYWRSHVEKPAETGVRIAEDNKKTVNDEKPAWTPASN
jgi:hypothetical protein